MAMSRYESKRRQIKALEKDTKLNPRVQMSPELPIGHDKLVEREPKAGHPSRLTKTIKKKK